MRFLVEGGENAGPRVELVDGIPDAALGHGGILAEHDSRYAAVTSMKFLSRGDLREDARFIGFRNGGLLGGCDGFSGADIGVSGAGVSVGGCGDIDTLQQAGEVSDLIGVLLVDGVGGGDCEP